MMSAVQNGYLRRVQALVLSHTYTRTRRPLSGAPDDEGSPTATPAVPELAIPCYYTPDSADTSQVIRADGRLAAHTPLLQVALNDPLTTGDLVTNIRDASGALLLAGPLVATVAEVQAGPGQAIRRVVHLEGATPSRSLGLG